MRRSTVVLGVIAVLAIAASLLLLRETTNDDPSAGSSTTGADASSTTTPSTTTTTFASGIEIPAGSTVCDLYGTLTVAGTIQSETLVEASGIAVSRTTPDVLWSHNDSRDGPNLYAFRSDGTDLGVFTVPSALALDWEDMGAGPAADGTGAYLYAGDIGDNFEIRDGLVAVYRVEDLDPIELDGAFPESVPLPYRFPDGAVNAEALFVDAVDPAIYIVTKTDDLAGVYRGSLEPADGPAALELVAEIPLGAQVSGADISADGSVIAFRGYRTVWMWHRMPGQTIADALAATPCEAPSPDEVQGEAIGFDSTYSYYTVSEELQPAIYRIPFEE